MKRLFVYGTLKRGFRAEGFLKEATFICTTKTRDAIWNMTAYHPQKFPYPAVQEGGVSYISGEIYEVPDHLWPDLDAYEQIEDEHYKRETIVFDQDMMAEIYIDTDKKNTPIPDHASIHYDAETKTYTWR